MTSCHQSLHAPDSFRILTLHSGSGPEALICDLTEVTLSQKPSFEALSYRWTDPDKETPLKVSCNDVLMPVGPNLYAALIRFRLADRPRTLWVDQLCIRQTDESEVPQQLSIMSEIYSTAGRVLAWLGPAEDESDKAMILFPRLVDRIEALEKSHLDERDPLSGPQTSADYYMMHETLAALPELEASNKKALLKLFQRAFFSRVWVLQELALGRSSLIVCGEHEFPYSVLEKFNVGSQVASTGFWDQARTLLSDYENGHDPENPSPPINTHILTVSLLKDVHSGAVQRRPVRVLDMLRGLACLEAKDRVYSVLRFLPQELATELTMAKQSSVREVFEQVAIFELTRSHSMAFLSAAGMNQQRQSCRNRGNDPTRPTLQLPTWVADWTYWINTYAFWVLNADTTEKGHAPLYQAADSLTGEARMATIDRIESLCVQGHVFDEIQDCVEPFGFPIVYKRHTEDRTYLQSVQGMSAAQMVEYSEQVALNDIVNFTNRSMRNLKQQAELCMAMAEHCHGYIDHDKRATACQQTLLGGTISHQIGSMGGEVQAKAKDNEVKRIFAELEVSLEIAAIPSAQIMRRFQESGSSTVSEEDMSLLLRMQQLTREMKHFRWPNGSAVVGMSLACKGRRFFRSRKGYMGLAPDLAGTGDKICLIQGCCTPFIIRKKGPGFALVGESYVHGVMGGELMSHPRFQDLHLL